MNFAELRFWGWLALALSLVLLVRSFLRRFRAVPPDFDKYALLMTGLFLLLCVSRETFLIFLAVTVGTYAGLRWIIQWHGRAPRRYLIVLIPLQLLPLFYYKYANFVARDVLGMKFDFLREVAIPVGISFYTFQMIAFVLDTLGFKQPMPRFVDYMNFAGFFPQIVAGPIERRKDLLPQIEQFRFTWQGSAIAAGVSWLVVGLYFKCCLADNLAAFFRPVSTDNAYSIWLHNVLFGFRIYYDFAGYSLIALGVARCLGIRLTLNFASPYCASSMVEFWRRWHITLSQWFRDYLYVPLGGGRVRWWAVNVLIVFIASGIWHGAGWNFVLWGALHGVFLVLNRALARRWRVPPALAWIITMGSVFLAWLCFYETRVTPLLLKLKALITPGAYSLANVPAALAAWSGAELTVIFCVLTLVALTLLMEWQSLRRGEEPFAVLRRPGALVVLVVLTVVLSPGKTNGFIYFAF